MAATGAAIGHGGRTAERAAIVGGLLIGVVLGMAGNIPGEGSLQNILFAASSVGLVVASALLVLQEARREADLVAVGFAIFAVAEVIIWVGGGTTEPASDASFAAATLFFVPALMLISAPPRFAVWARAAGALAAVPFGIHSAVFLLGREPAAVLEIAGYLLLSVAVIGWIVDLIRASGSADNPRPS